MLKYFYTYLKPMDDIPTFSIFRYGIDAPRGELTRRKEAEEGLEPTPFRAQSPTPSSVMPPNAP